MCVELWYNEKSVEPYYKWTRAPNYNRFYQSVVPIVDMQPSYYWTKSFLKYHSIVFNNNRLKIVFSIFLQLSFHYFFFRHFILSWNFNIWKRLTVEKSEQLLYHFNYAYVDLFLVKNNGNFSFSARIILFSSYKVYRIITTILSSWISVTGNPHLLTWITEATRGFSSSDVSIVGAPGLLSIGSLPLALQKRVENGIPNWILAECTDRPFLWDKCNRFIYIVFIVQ